MKLFLFFLATIFTPLSAHINNTSLSVKGGESFVAGQEVLLTWKIAVIHQKTNFIYFSEATDKPWILIDSVPEKAGIFDMKYTWRVPPGTSSSARIRIFQSFVAKPGEISNDYTIVSNVFSITQPTGVHIYHLHSKPPVKSSSENRSIATDLIGRSIDPEIMRAASAKRFHRRRVITRP